MSKHKWVAYYAPAADGPDLTKGNFPTKKKAEKYIQKHLCKPSCESCRAEWFIVRQDKFERCTDFDDIMGAIGAKIVYSKQGGVK